MTDDLLSVMNRRAAVDAVRAEAARAGLDADQLLDSRALYDAAVALDPDGPDFSRRVRALVGVAAPAARPAVTPATARAAARQWTDEDIQRRTPQECAAAADAGLLTSMGYGPRRQRRHP